MDKDTIARLRAALDEAKRVGFNTAVARAQDLTALLSIAERAADVEGMAVQMFETFNTGKLHGWSDETRQWWETRATAVSRYVLGGE